jgi:hypothetical protein
VVATGVIDAHQCAVGEQELIEPLLNLRVGERSLRIVGSRRRGGEWRLRRRRVQQAHYVGVFAAQSSGIEDDRH